MECLAESGVGVVAAEVGDGVERTPLARGQHLLRCAEAGIGYLTPDGAPLGA